MPAFSLINVKLMSRRVPAVVSTMKRKKMTELTKDTKHNRQDESTRPSLQWCKFTDRYLRFSRRFPLLGISRFLIALSNRKKRYHKAIKQSQTVYEQSPNQLDGHHVPTATHQDTERKSGLRSPKVTQFQMLVSRGGAGKDTERTLTGAITPARYLLFNMFLNFQLLFS